MAHFAKIDNQTNIVLEVNVVNNDDIQNLQFPDSEVVGITFLIPWNTPNTYWKQTSYNGNFRKHYAGVGYTYDKTNDVFIEPIPYSSWVLDTQNFVYIPPIEYPNDEKEYFWNESIVNWEEIIREQ